MARRSGTEKRRLSGGPVLVRLGAATRATVSDRAAAAGLTDAAWVRARLIEATDGDLTEAAPVQRLRPRRPPAAAHVIELAKLREVVAELAGAMVKAAVMTRADGAAQLHAEIEATLPAVRAAVRDLDTLKRALDAPEAEG
ncbi:hypothetical protein [Roseomonas mucosa]